MRKLVRRRGLFVVVWLACATAGALAADAPRSYEDYRLLRIEARTMDEVYAVERAGGVVLNCHPHPGTLEVVVAPDRFAEIEALGLPTEVRHADVAQLLAAERVAIETVDPFADFFNDFRRYDGVGGIVWYIDELAARYPALCRKIYVGETYEGRTIWGLELTNQSNRANKPGVFYFSAVHAREWATPPAPLWFATQILQSYASDPLVADMVDNVEIFLVPVVNVDGYEFTFTDDRLWRKTRSIADDSDPNDIEYGVDINRNWSHQWGFDDDGSSPRPSSATYRGPTPFSESETAALRDFMLARPNIRAMLDIHSFTQLILWPWGYTDAPIADFDLHDRHGRAMKDLMFAVHGMEYTQGPVNTTIYPVNGGSMDWTYHELGLLSFSYEMRPKEGAFGSGFLLPASEIIPACEDLYPAMLYLTNTPFVRDAVALELPDGAPVEVRPGAATTIRVTATPQTESVAAGSVTLHYRFDPADAYVSLAMQHVGGGVYEGVLPATNCASQPEFYVSALGDGGSLVQNPRPGPDAPYAATVATGGFYFESLASDPGWSTEGLWGWGAPLGLGGGSGDPVGGYTGAFVYGYNLAGDYESGLAPTWLTTTAIDCSGEFGVALRFWRWLGVESNFGFDDAMVEVSNDGVDWTRIWSAADTGALVLDAAWTYQEFDISSVADDQATVYIRWGHRSDSSVTFGGWNIDDVELYAYRCVSAAGDFDGDGLIGLVDFSAFASCFDGGEAVVIGSCATFDLDQSGALNLADFAAFQAAFGK